MEWHEGGHGRHGNHGKNAWEPVGRMVRGTIIAWAARAVWTAFALLGRIAFQSKMPAPKVSLAGRAAGGR